MPAIGKKPAFPVRCFKSNPPKHPGSPFTRRTFRGTRKRACPQGVARLPCISKAIMLEVAGGRRISFSAMGPDQERAKEEKGSHRRVSCGHRRKRPEAQLPARLGGQLY